MTRWWIVDEGEQVRIDFATFDIVPTDVTLVIAWEHPSSDPLRYEWSDNADISFWGCEDDQ